MQHRPVTPSCERILQRFSTGDRGRTDQRPAPRHLVAALLAEESLGAQCLKRLGITLSDILSAGNEQPPSTTAESPEDQLSLETACSSPPDFSSAVLSSVWCRPVVERAFAIAHRTQGSGELSSEHLLQAMVEVDGPVKEFLVSFGIDAATVLRNLHGQGSPEHSPQALKVDFELILDSSSRPPAPASSRWPKAATATAGQTGRPTADVSPRVLAIVDANLNRAREGLRVLEDFARFVRRDQEVTCDLKQLRHSLVACERELRREISDLMEHRNTSADAGTDLTTTAESHRQSLTDVVVANARRIQESLRSLEEFGKLLDPLFAMRVKQLRYTSYDLEQRLAVESTGCPPGDADSREQRTSRLESAQLYVLLTEANCRLNWRDVVEKSLAGGVDVLQLREKLLSDDEIVRRGKWISAACKAHNALFILNDRCEPAVAACADGVHIGQEDATVVEARRILDTSMLLGVSTHNKSQLLHACGQDVDYLGVGPVFPSNTKSFDAFSGAQFVAAAAESADRPWFAIGGIDAANLDVVLQSGARRVAVSNAVIASTDPERAANQLKQTLQRPSVAAHTTVRFEQG